MKKIKGIKRIISVVIAFVAIIALSGVALADWIGYANWTCAVNAIDGSSIDLVTRKKES